MGLKQSELAERAGRDPSVISKIERGASTLPETWQAIADALGITLDDLKNPPPAPDQPITLANATPAPAPAAPPEITGNTPSMPLRLAMPADLPVMGCAAGSLGDGAFQLTSDIIEYVRRPPALTTVPNAFALYVSGESMAPAYFPGDLVFVHPSRPARPGEDIVFTVDQNDGNGDQAYIKTLYSRNSDRLIVTQHNPKTRIEFNGKYITGMYRVMRLAELFAG